MDTPWGNKRWLFYWVILLLVFYMFAYGIDMREIPGKEEGYGYGYGYGLIFITYPSY